MQSDTFLSTRGTRCKHDDAGIERCNFGKQYARRNPSAESRRNLEKLMISRKRGQLPPDGGGGREGVVSAMVIHGEQRAGARFGEHILQFARLVGRIDGDQDDSRQSAAIQ